MDTVILWEATTLRQAKRMASMMLGDATYRVYFNRTEQVYVAEYES